MNNSSTPFDPTRDLRLERVVPTSRQDVWAAWTVPALMTQWFTPAPWTTRSARVDLRPGGECTTVMVSPEGQEFPNTGCILECVANERLVFTSALAPGFRPAAQPFFTAVIELADHADGTLYRATALHKNAEDRQKHEAMGFHTGWGKALDQLVELMSSKGTKR